ncbi:MAG: hypothetical protein VKJ09_15795, partial [Leptolyngbya sp.]|nr:hypothetical protein [Leptolyngbya sp.]
TAALEQRLQQMLTQSEWAEVAWRLGEHEAVAARYQSAGLSPPPSLVGSLRSAGLVCESEGQGGPVQGLGDAREDLDRLTWCRDAAG